MPSGPVPGCIIDETNEDLEDLCTILKKAGVVVHRPTDLDFVALTYYLKGFLWTGDKILYNGLKKKGFKKVVNTQELLTKRIRQPKK